MANEAERRVIDVARRLVAGHAACVRTVVARERLSCVDDARARAATASDHLRAQGENERDLVDLIDALDALDVLGGSAAQ